VPSPGGDRPFAHELRPGDAYAPLSFRIAPELTEQFLFALRDYRPECLEASAPGEPLVHPALVLHMSARTRSPSFRLAPGIGSVFAQDDVVFVSPARVGEVLDVRWTIGSVYEKRGRLYQALHTAVTHADGRAVLRREAHSVFYAKDGVSLPLPEGAAATTPSAGADPSAERAPVVETIAGRVLELSLARILAFSGGALDEPGWPQANLHTSSECARDAGLEGIIASGTQAQGLIIGLLIDTFGQAWLSRGRLALRFRKPVPAGACVRPILELLAATTSEDASHRRASVWCENANGERVVEGSASCAASTGAG
jgi:acyl dehydratase